MGISRAVQMNFVSLFNNNHLRLSLPQILTYWQHLNTVSFIQALFTWWFTPKKCNFGVVSNCCHLPFLQWIPHSEAVINYRQNLITNTNTLTDEHNFFTLLPLLYSSSLYLPVIFYKTNQFDWWARLASSGVRLFLVLSK